MATLSNYIKLTKSQYQTLISQGYIIVNGTRYDYDANAIYLVEDNAEYVDLTSSQTIRGQKTFEQIKVGDANNSGILHLYDGANGGYANIQSFDDSFSFNDYDGNTIRINPSDNELVTRDDYYISFPQDDGTFALTKNYYDKTTSDGRFIHKYSSGVTTSSTLAQLYSVIGTEPALFQVGNNGIWYIGKIQENATGYYGFEFEAFNYPIPGSSSIENFCKGRWTGAYVDGNTILSNLLIADTTVSNAKYLPYATENYVNTNFYTKTQGDDRYVRKDYTISTDATLSALVGIIGQDNLCVFTYNGSKYIGAVHNIYSTNYSFDFENISDHGRFAGGPVAGGTFLQEIFSSSGIYYKPYELESYVSLSGTSGTLTSVELEKVQRPNAIIKLNNNNYYKIFTQTDSLTFESRYLVSMGSTKLWQIDKIVITLSTGAWTKDSDSSFSVYTTTGTDNRYVRYDTNAQGLTDTQKSNARTNIGAGTSSFSGNYNDLTNKPTIPTVNNATLTITQNSTSVGTFTANASSNVTANIVTPKVYRYI